MRAISAMQNSGVIVSTMGQDIPQRVLSEPVSVPWMAIRKTVNATACHYNLRIQLAVRERQIGTHRLHPIVRRKGCYRQESVNSGRLMVTETVSRRVSRG